MTLEDIKNYPSNNLPCVLVSKFMHCDPNTLRKQYKNDSNAFGFKVFKKENKLCIDKQSFVDWVSGNQKIDSDYLPAGRFFGRKNEYVLHDDYATLIIRNTDNTIKAEVLIDIEDVQKCEPYRWNIYCREKNGNQNDYVRSSPKPGQTLMLHRLLVSCPENMEIDHINMNKLDNRKSNLRIVTHSQNLGNNKYSGTAFFEKKSKKWYSSVIREGKRFYTHGFSTPEEALKDRARIISELDG